MLKTILSILETVREIRRFDSNLIKLNSDNLSLSDKVKSLELKSKEQSLAFSNLHDAITTHVKDNGLFRDIITTYTEKTKFNEK